MPDTWRASPHFWVRSAGFPFETLDRMCIQRSRPLLDAACDGASSGDHPVPDTESGRSARWREAFELDALEARRALWRSMSDPLLQEAIFLSNRAACARVKALCEVAPESRPTSRSRQRIRLAWSYLQRFCAKNDTTSFFGPIAWGEIGPEGSGMRLEPGAGHWLARREVHLEHWVVQRLADSIAADRDVARHLPLRVNPGCRLEGDQLLVPIDRQIPIRGAQRLMLERLQDTESHDPITSQRLVAEIAESSGTPERRVQRALDGLLRSRIVEPCLVVPTVLDRPEDWLLGLLSRALPSGPAGADWRGRLEDLQSVLRSFERAGLVERMQLADGVDAHLQDWTGSDLARASGTMYAGRYPIYEVCQRNTRFLLSKAVIESVRPALESLLDVHHWLARSVAWSVHERYLQLYRGFQPDARAGVDFLRFYSAARAIETEAIISRHEALLRAAWDRVLPDVDGDEARLGIGELQRLAGACEPNGWPASFSPVCTRVHSPDLLIAAADLEQLGTGNYRIVVGEVHPGVHAVSQPVALPFCSASMQLEAEVEELLAPGMLCLVDPPGSYQRSDMNWPACTHLLELLMPGTASRLPPEQQVPASRLRVIESSGLLRLRDNANGRQFDLMDAMPGSLLHALFKSSPACLGVHRSQRIQCGRLVVKRRSWSFRTSTLPELEHAAEEASAFLQLRVWARRHGLTRWMFLHSVAEPKPIFVDLDNPLALDLFYKKASEVPEFTLVEMLPSPDELWFKDPRGAYTCELRTSWWRAP